ncbi:MAG: TonB-dependent receptor [Saprospiraceae bacterium]|nr:TonB-dependent receptor [Saprospiraceae bacterium]
MKKALLYLLLCFVFQSAYAQFPMMGGNQAPVLKGKVKGMLLDSVTGESIGFATLVLRKSGLKTDLDGVLSDDNGSWNFENVKTGKYDIVISFLGYEEKVLKNVETTLKNPDIDLGKIQLRPSAILLDAVEVKEERSLVENKVDRIVYNAENDASIAGGDATDVLRKVPMLTVDLQGNVSLRGSQNVRILINGKPSGMFSNNIADALKMFPADQIKKVEVITSPSAKYDAEGSGGIINIITSKQNIEGIAGSVNASIGIRQNSLFTNLNAGKGRFGLSSSAAIFYSNPADGDVFFERIQTQGDKTSLFKQTGFQTTSRLGGNGNASLFYDFNGYHSINSSFNFRGFGFDMEGKTDGVINDQIIGMFEDVYTRTNLGDNFNGGFDWNTDYTMKFENQKDREFSIAVQYTSDNNDQDMSVVENHSYLTFINRDARIVNDGNNKEYTFQADYVHPFAKGAKLEIGGKGVLRRILSEYDNNIKNAEGQYLPDPNFSNTFDYDQNVAAGYLSTSFVVAKKWNFIAGARYEHTQIDGRFLEGEASPFENSYDNILPNVAVSRNLPNFRSIKLSYNQRIQRPSLMFINPFNNNTDFLNRVIGNPLLQPELTHQIEMAYNTNFKGFAIFSAVYYKKTTAIIDQILKIDNNGVSINTFQNIGQNQSFGLNLFTTKTIKKLTVRAGGNIFSYDAQGVVNGQDLSRQSYEYNLFFNGDFSFSGSLKADFFGFFKSPRRTLQGDNPAFSIYGMGIRKEFKNSSIGITLIEPHTPNKIFESNIKGSDFVQNSKFTLPFRSIGINFRYKFGNVDFKERKTKIKNNDLKAGEGDGGQQQGGGGIRN